VDEFYCPLILKYKPQAQQMGYVDYVISEDRFAGTKIDRFIFNHIYKEGNKINYPDV